MCCMFFVVCVCVWGGGWSIYISYWVEIVVFCWFKPLNYIKKGFLKERTWHQFENFSNRERGMKFSETIQSTKNSSTWSRKTMPSCRRIRWRGWRLRGASSTTWSKNSSEFWTLFHWKVLMVIHGHVYGKSPIKLIVVIIYM